MTCATRWNLMLIPCLALILVIAFAELLLRYSEALFVSISSWETTGYWVWLPEEKWPASGKHDPWSKQ